MADVFFDKGPSNRKTEEDVKSHSEEISEKQKSNPAIPSFIDGVCLNVRIYENILIESEAQEGLLSLPYPNKTLNKASFISY